MNILEEAKKLNVEISNWCSDLYIPVTEETKKLVAAYEFPQNITTFIANDDGKLWYDIPFAYTPYYNRK